MNHTYYTSPPQGYDDLPQYYQTEFDAISRSYEHYKGKFNWAAFLFGAVWALYRKLNVAAAVMIVLGLASFGTLALVYSFVLGQRGNWMLYKKRTKGKDHPF